MISSHELECLLTVRVREEGSATTEVTEVFTTPVREHFMVGRRSTKAYSRRLKSSLMPLLSPVKCGRLSSSRRLTDPVLLLLGLLEDC